MILFILLTILVLYVIVSGVWFIYDAKRSNVPGPIPWPIIGNGYTFQGDSVNLLKQIGIVTEKYGPIVRMHVLNVRFNIITDPKMMEAVTSNMDFITKADNYRFLYPWLGDGLLTSTGNKWHLRRKFLTPAFHFSILQSFLPIFLKNDKIFIKKLSKLATGKPIDVFPIVAMLALDNIAESAMGIPVNAQSDEESEYVKAISVLSEIMSERMFAITMMNDTLFKFHSAYSTHNKSIETLHKYTNKVIADRLKLLQESNISLENYDSDMGIKNKCPFLDLLLLSDIEGQKLDFQSVREEVDTFMFEGHDTTASAVSFALYCLSQHDDVQNKLYEEQKAILGDDIMRDPTFKELNQMKYLDLVIKESLRLFPAVPLIARNASKDIDVNGYKILKDTTVTMAFFHLHRNPVYFEDPLRFWPERFENHNNVKNYSWIPFSAGPRNCIGQKFAMMELKAILSGVVKHFKLTPSHIEPILGSDLVLRSKNGIHVNVLPRL